MPVEAGVEVLGTVARPKVRLVSTPDVPDSEKLAWLVLGRGRGDVSAADAATLVGAGSGVATLGIPGSPGVPKAMTDLTIVAPYNDLAATRAAFERWAELDG